LRPVLAALLLAAASRAAGEEVRVGLALGGGSARGLAHIGVVQVLEERGVPVDYVSGTSMGAIIGALYASGYAPSEIERMARSLDWPRLFSSRGDRLLEPAAFRVDDVPGIVTVGVSRGRLLVPTAAFSDYGVTRVLTRWLSGPSAAAGGDFDRLPVPFRAVATDLETGDRVVLGRGDLPRAVRASMSMPIAFAPVELAGRVLVDGGLVDNLPAGVVRELGASVVIAVDTGAPRRPMSADADLLSVVNRMTELMMASGNRGFAAPADVRIRPEVEAFESRDYARVEELVAAGRRAAEAAWPEIEARLGGRRAPPRAEAAPGPFVPKGRVASVTVKGRKGVSERLILRRLGVAPGGELDLDRALRGLDAVWASSLFSSAWLEVAPAADGALDLTVAVRERPEHRFNIGVAYNEVDNARGLLRFRHGNLLGTGERLEAAAQVDASRTSFVGSVASAGLSGLPLGYRAGVLVSDDKPKVYDAAGGELGRTRFLQSRGFLAGQLTLGRAGIVEAGVSAGRTEVDERLGVPYAAQKDAVVKAAVRVVTDTLDDRFLPATGHRLDVGLDQALPDLGSDRRYRRGSLRAEGFAPLGRRLILEGHAFVGVASAETPVYDLFRLGGPVLVPGRARDEMWGRYAGAAALGLSWRLPGPWRLVARAGAGNAWNEAEAVSVRSLRAGGSLGVVHASPLGPISVEVGVGAGRVRVYAALGFQ
jgi:NTE family protein